MSTTPVKINHKIEDYTKLNFLGFLLASFGAIMLAVFVSATQSYFITDALGIGTKVGSYIGTLGFYDELLSMCLVPFIGVLSDKIGARPIISFGFFIAGISLLGLGYFVRQNVYPWMLFWRLIFSVGLTSSIGVLTVMLIELNNSNINVKDFLSFKSEEEQVHIASTLNEIDNINRKRNDGKKVSIMGIMSGLGAVFAVTVLLRLPVVFGQTLPAGDAVRKSYYTVGLLAIAMSIILFFIVYHNKDQTMFRDEIDDLFDELDARDSVGIADDEAPSSTGISNNNRSDSYIKSLKQGIQLSIQNPMILLAYFGGFVARCITITVSLFVPFYINHYFYSSGKCTSSNTDKVHCPESYILSSILTGIANTMALVFAPVAGILLDKTSNHAHMLLIGNSISILGFGSISFVSTPDASSIVFVSAMLMGMAQITFIVSSMTMISNIASQDRYYKYKGSISGVSSFVGGIGILFINKVGGYLGDIDSRGPFMFIAALNILFMIMMLVLKRVKENDDRDFQSIADKLKATQIGRFVFRGQQDSVNF
ncbi:hypothetical protein CANARDRAFT_204014 [[Candida] arabinofermentans NRRL YB-2248]|uniref:Major facilitator superfamily (MFS) profile domain-containing protein n=1 Tax=[Candida] arabinofermentans NRRL YB-2248 TaxID=983967 RepID=A0A1E4SU69_9ASCO|nr:hypothetical protein CANARDRAFT_204014 [[Candida] arabinofermentans NRRL YB-2248]